MFNNTNNNDIENSKFKFRREYISKEKDKIASNTFDKETMITLSKFFNKYIIKKINYIIAKGKEADIYLAEPGDAEIVNNERAVILKLFRIETSSFFNMRKYIAGDPRFNKISKTKYSLVNEWCKKEFGNLQIAIKAGIQAPKPFMFKNNILAMSIIMNKDKPAPQLHNVILKDPEKVFDKILTNVKTLYKNKLVHADLSEYNILIADNEVPYIIDFGQAVDLRHPNALIFLKRDILNISSYFLKQYNITMNIAEIINKILKTNN
ncbi:MAG: serine protein kinase RIO [Candidatus Marsarchaeota archaeon]|jgi:RIO kinase 1|nr:serine protein kinase RIO [Candidatus Marsarchaeota archaeon]